MANIHALDGQVLELEVSLYRELVVFAPEFVTKDPLIFDEPELKMSPMKQMQASVDSTFEEDDGDLWPAYDRLPDNLPRRRPEVPGGSMRIFRIDNIKKLTVGEEWRVKVLDAFIKEDQELTLDKRRRVYVRIEILERIEKVSYIPDWSKAHITKIVESGTCIISSEDLPAAVTHKDYRLQNGDVIMVREISAGDVMFPQYMGQCSENTWLNREAKGIKKPDVKNLRRRYRELPEASGELIRTLQNRDRVVLF